MLTQVLEQYQTQVQAVFALLSLITALLHILFAGAVAKDAAQLYQLGQKPALVSATVWAFATLIGGVVTAAIYWFIHHSNLTRSPLREIKHDKH